MPSRSAHKMHTYMPSTRSRANAIGDMTPTSSSIGQANANTKNQNKASTRTSLTSTVFLKETGRVLSRPILLANFASNNSLGEGNVLWSVNPMLGMGLTRTTFAPIGEVDSFKVPDRPATTNITSKVGPPLELRDGRNYMIIDLPSSLIINVIEHVHLLFQVWPLGRLDCLR
eukprot:2505848-Amphidinium_carterae.1